MLIRCRKVQGKRDKRCLDSISKVYKILRQEAVEQRLFMCARCPFVNQSLLALPK